MADGRAWPPPPPRPEPLAPRRGFSIVGAIATTIALAILITLGVWQLQRLKWKEGLLAHIAALQSAPAQPLGPALEGLAHGRDVDFTRVRVTCPGLATAPFLQLFGLKDGQAGYRLISACPLEAGPYRSILVDRGFVPDTVAARPPVDRAAQAPVTITGILRVPDKASVFTPANRADVNRWFSRDTAAMARTLAAPQPAPVFLYAETSSNPQFAALAPAPLPSNIPNRHLEYALTWFGLAAALVGVYVASLLNRRKN
jgi:surfeit locus 1 family protein